MKRRDLIKTALIPAAAQTLAANAAWALEDSQRKSSAEALDVLVIGGGFAGLVTAVCAARSGARTMLIEKRAYCGGDGILSAGIIVSARSREHEAQNFKGEAGLEAYWKLIERGLTDEPLSKVRDNMPMSPIYSGIFKHDPAVLRRCAEFSPKVVELLSSFGVEFQPINPNQPFLLPSKPRSMPKFAEALLSELKRLNVRVQTDAAAAEFLTQTDVDGSTRVVGAKVKKGGEMFDIRARTVVTATGGFSDNMKLMRRYKRVWADIPQGFTAIGEGVPPGHDGDGIVMGMRIGAAVEDMESMPKLYAAPRAGQKSVSWILFDTDTAYLVDQKGRRFCNEHASRYAGCALECFRQDIDGAYVVFDEETFQGPNRRRWNYEGILASGGLVRGETVEEAARAAGVDPSGLRRTLETIARDAASGKGDSEFSRKDALFRALKGPIYIARPCWPVRFKTEGGLEVDARFRVLSHLTGQPINGLMAVGAACGSISTRLCDVIASGLIAGEELSRRAASS